jgi:hypothetical protein
VIEIVDRRQRSSSASTVVELSVVTGATVTDTEASSNVGERPNLSERGSLAAVQRSSSVSTFVFGIIIVDTVPFVKKGKSVRSILETLPDQRFPINVS